MKRSKFLIAACICSTLCLLIWFLPGSYTYLTRGDGCFVTSHTTLYAFFSAFSPLPLICAGISLWAVCIRRTNWPMVCVSLIAAILHAIFLSFIGMVFSLPFLLNLLGAGCLLIHRLNPLKKQTFFKNNP